MSVLPPLCAVPQLEHLMASFCSKKTKSNPHIFFLGYDLVFHCGHATSAGHAFSSGRVEPRRLPRTIYFVSVKNKLMRLHRRRREINEKINDMGSKWIYEYKQLYPRVASREFPPRRRRRRWRRLFPGKRRKNKQLTRKAPEQVLQKNWVFTRNGFNVDNGTISYILHMTKLEPYDPTFIWVFLGKPFRAGLRKEKLYGGEMNINKIFVSFHHV